MAKNETKHKSKYKEPKDFAKSLKPETRKDLKDYIKDLVRDCMWDFSGEIQPGPRKDDKWDKDSKSYPFVHNNADGKNEAPDMVPNRKDADNAYPIEMMQDGDPKMYAHAKKVFAKNIEKDGEEYLEALQGVDGGVTTPKLKESIDNLTESQKEKLVRMYVRNKIVKVLQEQATPLSEAPEDDAEPAPTEIPTEPETPATETPATETPAPEEPAEEPTAEVEPETEKTPEQKAAEQKAAEEKAKKDFTQVISNEALKDTITGVADIGLQPLLTVFKSMDPKKVKKIRRHAIRVLLKAKMGAAEPSNNNQ
jgi:outer membrane biosynthesis protein TonB